MVDYNIEFGHIYLNENTSKEHLDGAKKALKIAKKIKKTGKSFCFVLLIDDYNPDEHLLKVEEHLKKLKKIGMDTDFLVYESSLVKFKDFMLSKASQRISRKYANYIKQKGKSPCSLLISIWHSLRLGVIRDGKSVTPLNGKTRRDFYAKHIITILPERFKDVEKMGSRIIKSTDFSERVINRSETIFI